MSFERFFRSVRARSAPRLAVRELASRPAPGPHTRIDTYNLCASARRAERFGFTLGWGAVWRLPRAIGWTRAKQLTLLGEPIDGREAARLGLVTTAVPVEQVDAEVERIVEKLRWCSPNSVALTKHSMAKSWSAVHVGGVGPAHPDQGRFGRRVAGRPDQLRAEQRPVVL